MAPLKPGSRLRSAVCDTEVMVIAAPAGGIEIRCGGAPMLEPGVEPGAGAALDPASSEGTLLGKRYVNEAGDLELLCVKPGKGSLSTGGAPLAIKGAKPLPASD